MPKASVIVRGSCGIPVSRCLCNGFLCPEFRPHLLYSFVCKHYVVLAMCRALFHKLTT